ncbi:unnamed protein product [Arctogadus glacialis]
MRCSLLAEAASQPDGLVSETDRLAQGPYSAVLRLVTGTCGRGWGDMGVSCTADMTQVENGGPHWCYGR